jgi:hypothetical protein
MSAKSCNYRNRIQIEELRLHEDARGRIAETATNKLTSKFSTPMHGRNAADVRRMPSLDAIDRFAADSFSVAHAISCSNWR